MSRYEVMGLPPPTTQTALQNQLSYREEPKYLFWFISSHRKHWLQTLVHPRSSIDLASLLSWSAAARQSRHFILSSR